MPQGTTLVVLKAKTVTFYPVVLTIGLKNYHLQCKERVKTQQNQWGKGRGIPGHLMFKSLSWLKLWIVQKPCQKPSLS